MIGRSLAASFLIFVCALGANAQSRAELALKIERLEREMIALENRVRSGNAPAQTAEDAASIGDRALLADLAAKIGSVERSLRTLTGRLEEIEYKQSQLDSAVDLLRRELALQQQEASELRAAQGRPEVTQQPPAGQVDVEGSTDGSTEDAPPSLPVEPDVLLPDGDAAVQYDYAFDFIKKNDLDKGFKAMDLFLAAHPSDARAGNAKFWLGRIHLLRQRMPQAAQQLLALIEEHPNHAKRADALLDLADVLIALDSKADACNALAEFRRSDDKASGRLKARAERTASQAGCDY